MKQITHDINGVCEGHARFSFNLPLGFLSPGYLGDGDVVTQAIHDAKLLLRSHGTGGREREKDRDRGGKMVSCGHSL